MQIVYYLSSPEEEGEQLKVGYTGCAEDEFEPFHEEVVKVEDNDDAEEGGAAKIPAPAMGSTGSEPVAPGSTRSGLQRGKVKVPPSGGKKRKFKASDLASMTEEESSAAEGRKKASKKGLSLVDEDDVEQVGGDGGKATEWHHDLVLDDLSQKDVPGGSGSEPLIVENVGDEQVPPVLRPTPIRAIPAPVNVGAPTDENPKSPVRQAAEENVDFGSFLDNLVPASCADPLRGVSDAEAFARSDESLVHHLRWALDARRRYRAAFNNCETLRAELEIEQGHVNELKLEVDELREEKKSWSKLTDEVIRLRATDQNQQATISGMKMAIDGLKSDLLNRKLQVEEMGHRVNDLESKVGEQGGVISAKDQEMAVLRASQASTEESLAAALGQVTMEREAKEKAMAELAKLRAGLGTIGDKVLIEPGVAEPVNAYALGMMEYGSHRAAVRAQKGFEKDPPELPEDLLQMIKPDSKARTKQLFEALKNAKSAYAAKLAASSELSVDELLALEP